MPIGASPVTKVLIPAAGRGTRFLPLTKAVPKELAPIVSTPALELVVAEAAANGLSDVLLVLSQGKGAIAEYFAKNSELEAILETKGDLTGLRYVQNAASLARIHHVEQLEPRGLGDAVAHGEQFAAGDPLAVFLPDDLVDDRDSVVGPMLDVYAKHGGVVLAALDVPRSEISKYGCIAPVEGTDLTGEVITVADLIEKPPAETAPSTLAIMGRYVLPPEIFDALRRTRPGAGGEIQLTDAMRRLARNDIPVHAVVFRGRRYDTGDRLEYAKAFVQLAQRHPEIGPAFGAWLREYVNGTGA
jgi:UTP--glucose-1-phosphate uridylyltransferase